MKIINSLNDLRPRQKPVSLTIGNFDGVHIGHQFLLDQLAKKAHEKNGQSLAITFKEHPKSVLNQRSQTSICTLAHKCKLLKEGHVDNLLLLPFTSEFAEQTADVFLERIQEKFAFSYLILGDDALFGKERHATKEHVATLEKRFNFTTQYLKLLEINGKKVSSSIIREEIQKGNFDELKMLLGRPYSIYGKIIKTEEEEKRWRVRSVSLDASNLTLPPFGVYAITIHYNGREEKVMATLGFFTTLQHEKAIHLKIHLSHSKEDMGDAYIDAIFDKFIRR